MKIQLLAVALLALSATSCRKDTTINRTTVVDNYIYDVGEGEVYQSGADKEKLKTPSQYISILYAHLLRGAIPPQVMTDLTEMRLAIGDKQLADELFLQGFIRNGNVQIPTNAQMRANIPQFVEDTYIRFLLRKPTPYEALQMRQLIEEDNQLTPELIYQGFALSNEYHYY